ncbi:MAG: hypothetical protein E7479_04290 [Ruminococcaceae bacterium]|nr:hypothetical protein [Oscillospiraceae bacterium]
MLGYFIKIKREKHLHSRGDINKKDADFSASFLCSGLFFFVFRFEFFAAFFFFLCFCGFFFAFFLVEFITACVYVAKEHYKEEHQNREKAEPHDAFKTRIYVIEVIEELEKPDYIADKGYNRAGDYCGFEFFFSAVCFYDKEKSEIEQPHCGNDYQNKVAAFDFLD